MYVSGEYKAPPDVHTHNNLSSRSICVGKDCCCTATNLRSCFTSYTAENAYAVEFSFIYLHSCKQSVKVYMYNNYMYVAFIHIIYSIKIYLLICILCIVAYENICV